MKNIILIGKSGSGKTTLIKKLLNQLPEYRKTQAIEYYHNMIDTPGEYLENKNYYRALLVSSLNADIILLFQEACDKDCFFPPGFSNMFNKPVIGIISKIDMNTGNTDSAVRCLQNAGVERIFMISSYTEEGLAELGKYLA